MASLVGFTRMHSPILSTSSRSWSSSILPLCCAQSPIITKRYYAGQSTTSKPELPKAPRQRSLQVDLRDHMEHQDLGMVPAFVMPTGDKLPSLYGETKLRMSLERLRIKQMLVRYYGMLLYRIRVGKIPKTSVGAEAEALYQNMYTSYAAGETDVLREICGQSLFSNFKMRLVSRPRAMSYVWELHELGGRTSVVDDRMAGLPQDLGYIRQAVIRIISSQSLTSFKDDIKVEGSGQVMHKTEYLVLQKKYTSGKIGNWIIWGTTDETKIEDLPKHQIFDFVDKPRYSTPSIKSYVDSWKKSINTFRRSITPKMLTKTPTKSNAIIENKKSKASNNTSQGPITKSTKST